MTKTEQNAKLNRENLGRTKRIEELIVSQQKQGKISNEAAQEILKTLTLKVSPEVIVEGDVTKTPSPADEMERKKNK